MRTHHTLIAAAFVLLAVAVTPVLGNESHFGVDDWTAEDIAKHLKAETKVDVQTAAIAAVGLQGSTLFAIADVDLSGLGLKPAETAAVRRSLVQLMNRVNTKPADFWEWRAANRRLFDDWIMPLSASPRTLLIWMRFFDSNEAIEHINDEIDETNIFVFGLQWLFVPSYPLYQVVSKASDEHSYMDELAMFVYGAGILSDIIGWMVIFGKGKGVASVVETSAQQLVLALFLFSWALFSYYIMWWIIPLFLKTIVFYIYIYLVYPVIILGAFFIAPLAAAAVGIQQAGQSNRRHYD